jgi:ABC-type transport system involved in multi-copper enzyme maturation permease subunit
MMTPNAASPVPGLAPQAAPLRVTQWRVIVSEWIKLRSLRSTLFSLLAALAFTIGFGIMLSAFRANDFSQNGFKPGPRFDFTLVTLRGLYLAQIPIGVLGVLMITGEYTTGMIRASLSAVPRRLPVLWAKALVYAVVAFVVMGVASLIAFEAGAAIFHGAGFQLGLSTPGATRAVLGAALYGTVVGLLGVGLGFLLRNTAGAIATLFGLLLVLPAIAAALPASLYADVFKYLPMPAGTQVLTTVGDPSLLSPWAGIGVFAIYAAVAIGAGAVMLKRRDA